MTGASWLTWVARKLASQDPAYLPRRLGYAARRRLVDRVFPTPGMRAATRFLEPPTRNAESVRAHFLARTHPRWHFEPTQVGQIAQAVPLEVRVRTIQAADALVDRRFSFRGQPPLALSPVDWNASADGTRAWTWDLNRHGWFVTLGFAHWYTGDPRYLETFSELSGLWIHQNLERLGRLVWDTPFEVGYRINAWIWAFNLFGPSPCWPAEAAARFLDSLGRLAEYLYHTIEYHSPGNHVLLEAKALALCGELFPEFTGAARWRAKGWRILGAELDRQICGDGVHAERSTLYHRIVAGELAELWLIARRNELSHAARLSQIVHRMAEFESWIDQGEGRYPLLGDACAEDPYYRFSARAVVDTVSNRTRPRPRTDREDYLWWATWQFQDGPEATPEVETAPRARAFPEGGYFVSRSAGSRPSVLVWDCGPIGYAANRKHAHLDALAFTLSVDGLPVLIDPGVESVPRSEPFRGTRGHNTVVVDGLDQADLAARGEIWFPPESRLLLWATSKDCDVMQGCHDGYARLADPIRHVRTIVARHGAYWLVLDHLAGQGSHHVEQRSHFSPSAVVTLEGSPARIRAQVDGVSLSFVPIGPRRGSALHTQLERGLAEQVYGQPTPITVLSVALREQLPVTLALAVIQGTSGVNVSAAQVDHADSTAIDVRIGSVRERVVIRHGAPGARELIPGWRTDGQVLVMLYGDDDRVDDVLVAGGTTLTHQDRELLPATEASREGAVVIRCAIPVPAPA